MMLSGAGVVFCLAFYLLAVSGIFAVPGKDAMLLFIGIFPIWLPTILFMGRLTSEFKQKDLWKAALRGCPSWMRVVLYVLIGAAFLAFLFPLLTGGKPGEGPFTFMLFPSTFYAISFCVMYSLLSTRRNTMRVGAASMATWSRRWRSFVTNAEHLQGRRN